MSTFQRLAMAVVVGVVAWVGWRACPRGLQHARVTAISPGDPPIAHVAVSYAPGARPVSLVVNILGASCTGSVTITGITMFADIPLIGAPVARLTIGTTAIYRSFGRMLSVEQRFE